MTTYTFTRAKGGLYSADGLGEWKQRKWWALDTDARLADGSALTLRATKWNRLFVAETVTDGLHSAHVRGEYDKTQWMKERGILRWDGVDYEYGAKSTWKATYDLSRHGEELVEISIKGLKHDVIVMPTLAGQQVPPPLLLFAGWVALAMIQARNASM